MIIPVGKLRTEHIGVSKLTNALQTHIVLEVQNSRKIFIKNNRRYFLQVCKFIHLSTLISYQKVKWWHEWGEMKITMFFFFNECDSKNVFVSLYIATKDKQLWNIFFLSDFNNLLNVRDSNINDKRKSGREAPSFIPSLPPTLKYCYMYKQTLGSLCLTAC